MRSRILALCTEGCLLVALTAQAQTPTGTISGGITDQSGAATPGVMVTAESPHLQGVRTAISRENGDFNIPLLPPGDYTVTFEQTGFQTIRRTVGVGGTQTVTLNEVMAVSGVAEEVTVVGGAEAFTQTTQVATKFTQDLIAALPSNRTLDAALLLSPGVHPTGPSGNYSIAGATSFEGLYTVNGVSVNDNLRGQPIHLYVEDALQETTVATSGISAEHGRFGGGVINAVTKSGGNLFSGSYRHSLNNDGWRSKTPFVSDTKTHQVLPTHEYTFGGPVIKERLWFFNAGRFQKQESSLTTASATALPYVRTTDERRYEGKLTYSPIVGHRVAGSYLRADQRFENFTQFNVLDLASLGNQEQHSNLWALHYTSVLSSSVFAEAQYSRRTGDLIAAGARTSDLIRGTLVIDQQRGFRYWSPTFCGVCGPDERDNDEVVLKGTYFWSSRNRGSHDIVVGYDWNHDHRLANSYQSGSNYRILGTTSLVRGTEVYPVFASGTTAITYTPVLQRSMGTDLVTHSALLNDKWRYNPHLTVNLGFRWDRNQGEDAAGGKVSDSSALSPRLGIVIDPNGDSRLTVSASYARYVSSLNTSVAEVSPAGNIAFQQWVYLGPSINGDSNQVLISTEDALRRVFDWFQANGGTSRPTVVSSLPGVNTRINGSLHSPNAKELTFGVSRQLSTRGSVRADFAYRKYGDFYAHRADRSTGRVRNSAGAEFDLTLVENTDVIERRYRALLLQGTYRIGSRLDLGGNYTLSRAWGNFDGETSSSGPVSTRLQSYPEYVQASWFSPEGDLSIDQRHRLRVWGTYQIPIVDLAGSLNVAVVHQYGSGVPYGAIGAVNTAPFVTNPGYVAPSGNRQGGTWDYYFTARDAFRTEGSNRTDLAVNYAYRIPAPGRSIELFFHGEVLNILNLFQLCACGDSVFKNGGISNLTKINQGVVSPGTGGLQLFNPFTTTPVGGVNWNYAANFGTAVDRFAYTTPRTLRFNFGVRF